MAIKGVFTFLEWVQRLTKGYVKHTGKQPDNLAKLKINMEAAQKVKDQGKVVKGDFNPKEEWWKAGKKDRKLTKDELDDLYEEFDEALPYPMETVRDKEKFLKAVKDEEAYMFQQYKMGKLDPKPGEPGRKKFLEKKLEDMELSGDKRLMTRDEIEELSSFDLGTEMDEAIKKYKQKDIQQKRELQAFDVKDRTKQAAGGIAGQLHLNRQGYLFGGPAAGSKALKAIMNAIRENKKWGVGGPPYNPEATSFIVKALMQKLHGVDFSLADIKKMSEAPFSAGINKFNFPEFSKGWKNLKAGVIKDKLNESKMKAEAMIEAAKHVPADNATAKQMKAQFTRSGKEQLKEAKEGLKEIDIYIDMLAKKGRKLHAAGGLAQVLGV